MILQTSTNQFERELVLMCKRGKDVDKLIKVIDVLICNVNAGVKHHLLLPSKNRLHKLSGKYTGFWECHIEPDWLLIFYLDEEILRLERTGTHSDLVNKLKR